MAANPEEGVPRRGLTLAVRVLRGARKPWFPIFILLVVTLGYEPRLTLNQGLVITDDFFTSDLMNDRYPARVELGRAMRAGYLPLWTRLIYCGFPLQANPETGITYPPNLLLFGALPPALALNYSILLKFFLSGLFLFLLLRRLGLDAGAALFGAIAFAWSGFFVSHLRHLNMHDAGIWVPLMLYLLERYRGDRDLRWLLWTAAVFGVQVLAGHPQISYYTGLLVGVYMLWMELPRLRHPRHLPGVVAKVVLVLGLGAALGMVQVLPTLQLSHWSERAGGVSYEFANRYQYHLPDLLTFLYPYVDGDPGKGTYKVQGIFWEDYGYVGLLPLLAAAYAVVRGLRNNRYVRFFAILGGVAGLLMLGDQAGLYRLVYHLVPGMDYFRFANRFILLVDLSLCVLAGIGLNQALEDRGAWIYALCIALLVADLFPTQRRQNPVVDRARWEQPPATAQVIRRDPDPRRTYPFSGVQTHLAAYRAAGGWEGDLSPYVRQRASLQPSGNMLYGIATANGYMNLVPRYLIRMWGNEKTQGLVDRSVRVGADGMPRIGAAFVRNLSAYSVKYLVSIWPLRHPSLSRVAVRGDYAVYRNEEARPRCRFMARARAVGRGGESRLVAGFVRRGMDPDSLFIHTDAPLPAAAGGEVPAAQVDTDTPGGPGAAAQVRIVEDTDLRIAIECAGIHAGGWLFLADTFYPGWRARVDGRSTPVYRANLCGRAVYLPPGARRVVFTYRPEAFYRGLWISGLALGALVAGLLWSRRKARGAASAEEARDVESSLGEPPDPSEDPRGLAGGNAR